MGLFMSFFDFLQIYGWFICKFTGYSEHIMSTSGVFLVQSLAGGDLGGEETTVIESLLPLV